MSVKAKFKINGKEFFVKSDLTRVNSFEVKSIPRSYTVTFDVLKKPYETINKLCSENRENLILIDKKVYNLYGKYLRVSKDKIFTATATEDFKTLNGIINVINFLQKNQFTKGEKLIVVGGGIIQDVGAFVGACYKRGIPWIYVPTTLLSMCDSCIGGKTGINHNNAKNQLALFSAPFQVVINTRFLETLYEREIKSGLGEILKLHIIGGKKFLKSYIKYVCNTSVVDISGYKQLIFGALSVKRAIIEEDEFELNYRKSLNYGHTVGHVIEALSNYEIPHGLAVVAGIVVANELSSRKLILENAEKGQLNKLLFDLLDIKIIKIIRKLSFWEAGELLKKDKKTMGEFINFVALKSIGDIRFLSLKIDSLLVNEISKIIKEVFHLQ